MSRQSTLFAFLLLSVSLLGISVVFAGESPEVAQASTPIIIPIGTAVISGGQINASVQINPTIPFVPSATQTPVFLPTQTTSPFNRRPIDPEGFWYRFESIELTQYQGVWQLISPVDNSSDRGYHRSLDLGAVIRFVFTGTGVRLGYRVSRAGGDLHLLLDGQALAVYTTTDSNEERTIIADAIYFSNGTHVVDIVANGLDGQRFEIDFLDVYVGPEHVASSAESAVTATPDGDGRVPLVSFDLVTMPNQVSTVTPLTEVLVSINVIAFYDGNVNTVPDANEGIAGLSLRVLDSVTNQVLASTLTDRSGSARIQVISSRDLVLVVPLLGRSREISLGRGASTGIFEDQWLIEVEPINIPALIP